MPKLACGINRKAESRRRVLQSNGAPRCSAPASTTRSKKILSLGGFHAGADRVHIYRFIVMRSPRFSQNPLPAVLALLASVSAMHCAQRDPPSPADSASAPVSPPGARNSAKASSSGGFPLAAVALGAASRALASLETVRSHPLDGPADGHPAYLAFRRAVSCGAPFWQRAAPIGSEALIGPPRSLLETGGAVLLLDTALAAGDRAAFARQAEQVEKGLRLVAAEMERTGISPDATAAAISAAAYDLGALALESTSGIPTGHAAVLADMHGTLDAVEQGATALAKASPATDQIQAVLAAVLAAILPLEHTLQAAKTSLDLSDRASFVVATGRLGVAVRRLATAAGARVRPPYAPRIRAHAERESAAAPWDDSGEPISALTLPAPRLTLRGPDPYSLELARLGRDLFLDTRLSKGGVRSCASCHIPARAFSDGLVTPKSLERGVTLRHTPALLYTSLHAAQLWDGRTLTAESQALGVIHSRAEMGLSTEELLAALAADPAYRQRFASIPGPGLTAANIGRALAAFEVLALSPADAPIDRFARGDSNALSADQRAGLDVFVGAGRCARCHIPPFFGGSRPRDFAVPVFAVLGVPADPSGRAPDPDRGRALVTHRAADEGSFKTPTVRNISRTAPYFHNGRFPTLAAVIDFYNRGGGLGLGLDVPHQDPDVRPLKLSAEQIRLLLSFLHTALLDETPPEALVHRMGKLAAERPR
jgi:cytochrome c peroxidase